MDKNFTNQANHGEARHGLMELLKAVHQERRRRQTERAVASCLVLLALTTAIHWAARPGKIYSGLEMSTHQPSGGSLLNDTKPMIPRPHIAVAPSHETPSPGKHSLAGSITVRTGSLESLVTVISDEDVEKLMATHGGGTVSMNGRTRIVIATRPVDDSRSVPNR